MTELEAQFERMKKWAIKVNARLDALEGGKGLQKAMTGGSSLEFPEAIDDLELPPVPEDYDGRFATWSPDNEANQMRITAPISALDNPPYTEEDGGETYLIIPVISKAGKAGWIGVREGCETNIFEGRYEINQGEALSKIAFDDLRSVRGKQTEIDLEAWATRCEQKEAAEAPQYEPANEDPF